MQVERFPLSVRLLNAPVAYLEYVRRTVWPAKLGVMYPHPGGAVPLRDVLLGLAILVLGALLALLMRRRRPAVAVGWLWFCGALVPVIGLVQVGEQSFADRYTYLPIVGIFMGIAWGVPQSRAADRRRMAVAVGLAGVVAALAAASARQVESWANNRSLYRQALAAAPENWMMHANLAAELLAAGELAEALAHQREVVRLRPDLPEGRHNLGLALERLGLDEDAAREYRECLRLNPHHPRASRSLGRVLLRLKRPAEALPHLLRAATDQPDNGEVRLSLGDAYVQLGDLAAAEAALREAVRIDPKNNWARMYWENVRARVPRQP
ncbi:MAG TPA: tetratricopeptide repeat protein [bacterium]